MDIIQEQTREQLTAFSKRLNPYSILPAIVTALNDDDTIAVQLSNGSIVDDVRLKSVIIDGNAKALVIPVVSSAVVIASIENSSEYVVIAVNEIKEVVCIIDETKFSVTSEGFLIKKGIDTLRDAMTELIEAVEDIIVLKGRNPNRVKLASSKQKVQNILRS